MWLCGGGGGKASCNDIENDDEKEEEEEEEEEDVKNLFSTTKEEKLSHLLRSYSDGLKEIEEEEEEGSEPPNSLYSSSVSSSSSSYSSSRKRSPEGSSKASTANSKRARQRQLYEEEDLGLPLIVISGQSFPAPLVSSSVSPSSSSSASHAASSCGDDFPIPEDLSIDVDDDLLVDQLADLSQIEKEATSRLRPKKIERSRRPAIDILEDDIDVVVVEDSPASMVAADPLKRKSRKMKTGKSQQEQGQKEEVMEEIKVINISFCLVAHEDTKCVLPVDKYQPLARPFLTFRRIHGLEDSSDLVMFLDSKELDTTKTPSDCQIVNGDTIFVGKPKLSQPSSQPVSEDEPANSHRELAVSIVLQCGKERRKFKILMGAMFSKLHTTFCQKMDLKPENVRFEFDGSPLNLSSTPEREDLEGGEVIDVIIKQQ